jgi:hypothetical protein
MRLLRPSVAGHFPFGDFIITKNGWGLGFGPVGLGCPRLDLGATTMYTCEAMAIITAMLPASIRAFQAASIEAFADDNLLATAHVLTEVLVEAITTVTAGDTTPSTGRISY